MTRPLRLVLCLAAVCLLASGCSRVGSALGLSSKNPDPTTAIALSVSSEAIYLVDPATGRRAALVNHLADFQSGYAVWAPGHGRLAYGNNAIYLLDPATKRTITVATGPSLSMPAWDGRGLSLAYGDGSNLWVAGAAWAAGIPDPVPVPRDLAPLGMTWYPGPAIAFQGLELTCPEATGCSSTDLSEIYTVQPDGTSLRKLTQVGHAEKPKWSPDGSSILFIRRLGGRGHAHSTELWAVNADGTGTRQLLKVFNAVAADWSPDGRHLAIVRRSGFGNTLQLWIADADGSNLHPLGPSVPGIDATIDW